MISYSNHSLAAWRFGGRLFDDYTNSLRKTHTTAFVVDRCTTRNKNELNGRLRVVSNGTNPSLVAEAGTNNPVNKCVVYVWVFLGLVLGLLYVFYLVHVRGTTASIDFSSILQQRIDNWEPYHQQQQQPPSADSCDLLLYNEFLRRILCLPTRDTVCFGTGVCFLRRILCLPTRGYEQLQGTATSKFGFFLWKVREESFQTFTIYHSCGRVYYLATTTQLSSEPRRDQQLNKVFMSLQFSVGASLKLLSKHNHNHTFRVNVLKIHPQHPLGLSSPNRCADQTLSNNARVDVI